MAMTMIDRVHDTFLSFFLLHFVADLFLSISLNIFVSGQKNLVSCSYCMLYFSSYSPSRLNRCILLFTSVSVFFPVSWLLVMHIKKVESRILTFFVCVVPKFAHTAEIDLKPVLQTTNYSYNTQNYTESLLVVFNFLALKYISSKWMHIRKKHIEKYVQID